MIRSFEKIGRFQKGKTKILKYQKKKPLTCRNLKKNNEELVKK